MVMITESINISAAGQLVLPKSVRNALNSRQVAFEIIDDQVILRPIHSLKGLLASYNKKTDPFKKMREQAWLESVHE